MAANGMKHAVARLRATRLAASAKPFVARGSGPGRCPGCRLAASHCVCALRPSLPVNAGVCLIMGDIEALKPSNTGWLVADVVPDTFAFGWARTAVDPALPALLADPQWQPWLVFPAEYAEARRVVTQLPAPEASAACGRRPLFVVLDGTWSEARKMFRKSPYLDALPVLSPAPGRGLQLPAAPLGAWPPPVHRRGRCRLSGAGRRRRRPPRCWGTGWTCSAPHYLSAKRSVPLDRDSPAHQRLQSMPASG
jgi:DTW domain-containing protein YfiP